MARCVRWLVVASVFLGLTASCRLAAEEKQMLNSNDVVVALGDSITDGNTYAQIVMQALGEAKRPVPPVICAGVGGDTAAQMAARLERDVLCFKPSVVTFSAGTNDCLRGVKAEAYEEALRSIAARVQAGGARLVLLTPCVISTAESDDPKTVAASRERAAKAEALIKTYIPILRSVAAEYSWPVAESHSLMEATRAAGKRLMTADGIHPNYLGQSLMARAILDALGYDGVPLPQAFRPQLFPGVVRRWQVRSSPCAEGTAALLDAAAVAALAPDGTWAEYTLPDPAPVPPVGPEQWLEQCRRNGFGLLLDDRFGRGRKQAVAVLHSDGKKKAFVSIGAGVATLWLNGAKLHAQEGWTGYHAGKERYPVVLRAGENRLVAEFAGDHFFVSVTEARIWERLLVPARP